jgi:anti-sigma factor RsiW
MSERHPTDDLAAYALGALEPAEVAELERHLEACEHCRAELRWLEPAVDVLPSAVPQMEPPRSLRRNLMRTVRADARADRGGWWARRPGWITVRARPAIALGGAALLAAGVVGYALNESEESTGPVVTEIPAQPTRAAPNAEAVLERSEGEVTLRVERLPELGSERVYQVWFREGSVMHPDRTFTLDAEGRALADVGEAPTGAEEVLVTSEPLGGSEEPTTRAVLRAPLS